MASEILRLKSHEEYLRARLREVRDRRGTPYEAEAAITAVEANLRVDGFEPHQLYVHILKNTDNRGIRDTAATQFHNPSKVPEYAADEIADTLIVVMKEPNLDYTLGERVVMALSQLREYLPPKPVFQISQEDIGAYVIPFIQRVPPPRQEEGKSEERLRAEATLEHVMHMLPSTARLSVSHGNAYNAVLHSQLDELYRTSSAIKTELEEGRVLQKNETFFTHIMEHLAELMDQGGRTRDSGLVDVIMANLVVKRFNALDALSVSLGAQNPRRQEYFEQRDGFLRVAGGMGYAKF